MTVDTRVPGPKGPVWRAKPAEPGSGQSPPAVPLRKGNEDAAGGHGGAPCRRSSCLSWSKERYHPQHPHVSEWRAGSRELGFVVHGHGYPDIVYMVREHPTSAEAHGYSATIWEVQAPLILGFVNLFWPTSGVVDRFSEADEAGTGLEDRLLAGRAGQTRDCSA